MSFDFWREADWVFRGIWVLTALWCLVWPLTLLPSVMSLAAEPVNESARWLRYLWLLAIVYPVIFFVVVKLGQYYIAPAYYWLGVLVALLPTGFALFVLRWFFKA